MKNQGTFKRQPVLQLEDKMQDRFLMGFYPEDVTEIRTQDYQVGDTMVILYAFKYGDGKELIELRVLDTADVKVIPLELSRILALNHKVQLHNKTSAGKSACHACGTEGKALLKCAQCGLFWYCDSECQKLGWYRDGHDEDCKDLKKFKGLFTWDWANFEDYANSSII
ncbi:MAG: hypothetical protein M1819_006258 [Sarea resinae]|nr:MAG: hypothetical protein M1819_006258 [Sarea resinae]